MKFFFLFLILSKIIYGSKSKHFPIKWVQSDSGMMTCVWWNWGDEGWTVDHYDPTAPGGHRPGKELGRTYQANTSSRWYVRKYGYTLSGKPSSQKWMITVNNWSGKNTREHRQSNNFFRKKISISVSLLHIYYICDIITTFSLGRYKVWMGPKRKNTLKRTEKSRFPENRGKGFTILYVTCVVTSRSCH